MGAERRVIRRERRREAGGEQRHRQQGRFRDPVAHAGDDREAHERPERARRERDAVPGERRTLTAQAERQQERREPHGETHQRRRAQPPRHLDVAEGVQGVAVTFELAETGDFIADNLGRALQTKARRRRGHEDVIGEAVQHLGAELDHHHGDQPHRAGGDRMQEGFRDRIVSADAVCEGRGGHQRRAGQTHAQCRERGACGSAQSIADKDRHVGGIEARQGLADRKQFDERRVIDPALTHDERRAEVTHDATADAGGAHHEEDPEQLPERRRRCHSWACGGLPFRR